MNVQNNAEIQHLVYNSALWFFYYTLFFVLSYAFDMSCVVWSVLFHYYFITQFIFFDSKQVRFQFFGKNFDLRFK